MSNPKPRKLKNRCFGHTDAGEPCREKVPGNGLYCKTCNRARRAKAEAQAVPA